MLNAKIGLKRFDKNWRLLESREQPCRSFTQGFIETLYMKHAQIITPVVLAAYDVDGMARDFAMAGMTGDFRWLESTGLVTSPGGLSAFHTGQVNYGTNSTVLWKYAQGNEHGIQVGNDATAVTPLDRHLLRRIGHGVRQADGGDATLESYDVNDDGEEVVYANNWQAQCFIPRNDFRCSSVEVKIWKNGAPAAVLDVLLCGVRTTNSADNIQPFTTTPLASGTIAAAAVGASPGAFVACAFGTPVNLYAGRMYYIVLKMVGGDNGNSYRWRKDNTSSIYERSPNPAVVAANYTGNMNSNDAVTFSYQVDKTNMFRAIGRSIGDFEYSGCEIGNVVIANPNASFDITRFFHNRSGAAINVQEVGINDVKHCITGGGGGFGREFPTLVARDVVAPAVAVANTEILLVTYTVSITV